MSSTRSRLLVTELVTNAVLHARTELHLIIETEPGIVRLRVEDRSPGTPVLRHYDTDDVTGRGLALVEMLATRWGVDPRPDGKSVWCEITFPPSAESDEAMTDDMVSITLVDFPIALANRAGRHYEAIQREFALIHFSDEATRASLPSRLLELAERTRNELASGEIIEREQVTSAIESGVERLTISLRMPRSTGESMAALSELLVEADDFCREGDLITVAMPPDCRAFREWFLGEFVRQIAGSAPTAWDGPWEEGLAPSGTE